MPRSLHPGQPTATVANGPTPIDDSYTIRSVSWHGRDPQAQGRPDLQSWRPQLHIRLASITAPMAAAPGGQGWHNPHHTSTLAPKRIVCCTILNVTSTLPPKGTLPGSKAHTLWHPLPAGPWQSPWQRHPVSPAPRLESAHRQSFLSFDIWEPKKDDIGVLCKHQASSIYVGVVAGRKCLGPQTLTHWRCISGWLNLDQVSTNTSANVETSLIKSTDCNQDVWTLGKCWGIKGRTKPAHLPVNSPASERSLFPHFV